METMVRNAAKRIEAFFFVLAKTLIVISKTKVKFIATLQKTAK